MKEFDNAITLEFPLKGEWMAENTPGSKIPSHGTDMLGQTYAFDFVQVNWEKKGIHFYHGSKLKYYLFGVKLKENYFWGQNVYAPCDGVVLKVKDGLYEKKRIHPLINITNLIKIIVVHIIMKKPMTLQTALGNYIIMNCDNNVYACFAHFKKDSIKVKVGDTIIKGQVIGEVGHSGNSTSAHLHFQLMDNEDIKNAKGIPCVFEKYEVFDGKNWNYVYNSVPTNKDRFRF